MKRFYPIILIFIVFLFYFPVSFYRFVGDDYFYLLRLETSSNLREALRFIWQPTVSEAYFRPIAWFPYFLGYLLGAQNTVWFHLLNVIFHLTNTLLVYFIAKTLINSELLAFFSAFIFGLHPINAETVSQVAIFGDICFTFFCLVSLILFARFLVHRHLKFYLFSLVLFLFALLSKEAAIIHPFLIIFTASLLHKIKNIELKNFKVFIPYFLITGFYLIFRPASQFSLSSLMPTPEKILKLVYYMRDLVIPFEMNTLKKFVYENMLIGRFLISSLIILILCLYLFFKKFKQPLFYFYLIWLGLTLLIPVVIPFSPARRHLYLPLVGYSIFFTYFVFQIIKKKVILIPFLVLFLLLEGKETNKRNSLYEYAGKLVYQSLIGLKEDLPSVGKENSVFLIGIPGTFNNTNAFWSSPEDKIRFIYKDRNLSVFCLSVINFKKGDIPDTDIVFLDDLTFTYKMDTNLQEYIRPAQLGPKGEDWGRTKEGVEYKIAQKDKFGNINKIIFRLPETMCVEKTCYIIGWKEDGLKLLKKIRRR